MPPQLRLIENEETGDQGLWNPETQSLFDPKDYRVVQNDQSGQQALFDPTSQSIIAYLPSRAAQAPTEPPVEAPTVTPEIPVEYEGRAGTTPYKPPIAEGGRYPSVTETEAGSRLESFFGKIKEKALTGAEVGLSAASRLAPFPGVIEAIQTGDKENIMRQVSRVFPRAIEETFEATVANVKKISPDLGKLIEDTMGSYPVLHGAGRVPRMEDFTRRIRERRTGVVESKPTVEEARPSEPAFVEVLKEERAAPPETRAPVVREVEPERAVEILPKTPDISLTKGAGAKQPWEITREEYQKAVVDPNSEAHDLAMEQIDHSGTSQAYKLRLKEFEKSWGDVPDHEMAVRKALSENKPVPPEVLAEYPDLAQVEIDRLLNLGVTRRQRAKDESIKMLRPADTDWMSSDELNRVQELQAMLPRESRADIQKRVAEKRAARVAATEQPPVEPPITQPEPPLTGEQKLGEAIKKAKRKVVEPIRDDDILIAERSRGTNREAVIGQMLEEAQKKGEPAWSDGDYVYTRTGKFRLKAEGGPPEFENKLSEEGVLRNYDPKDETYRSSNRVIRDMKAERETGMEARRQADEARLMESHARINKWREAQSQREQDYLADLDRQAKAIKFQKGSFEIQQAKGERIPAEGLLSEHFAIRKPDSRKGYIITHRGTGLMTSEADTIQHAKRIVAGLENLPGADWTFTDAKAMSKETAKAAGPIGYGMRGRAVVVPENFKPITEPPFNVGDQVIYRELSQNALYGRQVKAEHEAKVTKVYPDGTVDIQLRGKGAKQTGHFDRISPNDLELRELPPSPLTEADLAAQKLFGTRGGVEGEISPKGSLAKLTPLEQEMGHPVTETTFEGIPKGVTGSRLETGTTKLITEAGIEAFKSLGKELEPDIPVTIQLARAMQRGEVDLRGLERILESKGVSKEQFVESFITTASNAGRQLSQLAKVVKSLKNTDAAFGEIGKRLPLYTSILEAGKTFIEKGKLTVGEGSQLARDVIDSIRLNLFSVTSFSLDMIGNATEVGAQIAGGVGRDLVQVVKGHVNFPSLQAVIRTIKDRPRIAGVEKGLELTAIGEKLRGGFQKGPGTFTLRSTAASKGLDYLVGSPLYLKGVMDTGGKRFSAAMSIWQDAIMAANLKGLKGAERQNFYQKFWEKPPKTVIERAINEGNKAGFNRTLSKLEERYASSPAIKLLVDTFGRWPWQFTRWGAEMVGYNPELFKAIRQGKASAEDIGGYLAKTASGWGGLYLIDRALYDHVDFNSMEYVHADGDRTRLSSREPLASALWLLAVIKGDVEKAKGGFKFASIPGAQLLGEAGTPGILGGIIKQAQGAISRKGVDPRGLSRDLTNFFNRLIPGQAVLSAIESVFDPTLREGIGANIPGVSSLKPAVINPATGKPLAPRQGIPGTNIEFPQIAGVPIPGATRKLDPVTKVLSKFGLLVYRGPRQPLAGVPAGEAPEEVRREWLEAFGQKREKLISPLIPRIEAAEKSKPKEMQPGGRMYEAWRKRIQFYDSIAAKRATAEVNQKQGFRGRTKLPRQPTLRELRRPSMQR